MMIRTCESCKKPNVWTMYVEDLAGANICRECINCDFEVVLILMVMIAH